MPIYVYWGDDSFRLNQAAQQLRDRVLDAAWASFNFDKVAPAQDDAVTHALNQAMTPPFGAGQRLVWLEETTLAQRCPAETLAELTQTLPRLPDTSVLLLTSATKFDGRLKSTKLLQQHGEIKEFSAIPPWKTDLIANQVRQLAQEIGVKLTPAAMDLLAEAVGNDTRQLMGELEKLRLYASDRPQPLTPEDITRLVTASTQNSLQLAAAIRDGQTSQALNLVADLLNRNEPALRLVSTLVGQFRTWLWIKVMLEAGERDERAIAQAAEVRNPKRIYFLRKEVQAIPLANLMAALAVLVRLEARLKQGGHPLETLQTSVMELCAMCQAPRSTAGTERSRYR